MRVKTYSEASGSCVKYSPKCVERESSEVCGSNLPRSCRPAILVIFVAVTITMRMVMATNIVGLRGTRVIVYL